MAKLILKHLVIRANTYSIPHIYETLKLIRVWICFLFFISCCTVIVCLFNHHNVYVVN